MFPRQYYKWCEAQPPRGKQGLLLLFQNVAPPSDVRSKTRGSYVALRVTLACTDGRSNTHKHSASDKTTSPPSVLEVLPVFKSSLRPLSVDESSGWMWAAAGQPLAADESLGIMVSLCQEFLSDRICFAQFWDT